jgi:uncharacterized membrane protein
MLFEKPMKRTGMTLYAPGAVAAFVLGLTGLLVSLYPIVAAMLGIYGLFYLFFSIPAAGVICGSLALVYQNKTRKYMKRRSLARGMTLARIGLFTGVAAIFIGSSTAAGYLYIAHEKRSSMTQPERQAIQKEVDTMANENGIDK